MTDRATLMIMAMVIMMISSSLLLHVSGEKVYDEYEIIKCQSVGRKYITCPLSAIPSEISVVNKLSNEECILDETFGIIDDTLWVDWGCRAEFEIMYSNDVKEDTIRCESYDSQYHECQGLKSISSLQIKTMFSGTECHVGKSYGYAYDTIWVDEGCRGEFHVIYEENDLLPDTIVVDDIQEVVVDDIEEVVVDDIQEVVVDDIEEVVVDDIQEIQQVVYAHCEGLNNNIGRNVKTKCPQGGFVQMIELNNQRSKAECIQGETYGFEGMNVWVSNGCFADFVVYTLPADDQIQCDSNLWLPNSCQTNGKIAEIALTQQDSLQVAGPCNPGDTYYFEDDEIFVNSGCRARFSVRYES